MNIGTEFFFSIFFFSYCKIPMIVAYFLWNKQFFLFVALDADAWFSLSFFLFPLLALTFGYRKARYLGKFALGEVDGWMIFVLNLGLYFKS